MKIKELIETSKEYDKSKKDYLLDTKEFEFNRLNSNWEHTQLQMVIKASELGSSWAAEDHLKTSVSMTDWALRQLCQKLEGHPPTDYMLRCPPDLRAANLNRWREKTERKMLVRLDGEHARAFLSEKYSAVGNTSVLEIADEMLGDVPHEMYDTWIGPDGCHVRILVADHAGGHYKIGAYISNGEIGNTMIRVLPLVQRTSCKNSVIFGDGGFWQRHINVSYPFIRGAMKEHLGQAFNLSVTYVGKLVEAEMEKIPDIKDVINRICINYDFSQNVRDDIMRGTEGQDTAMAVTNGLSFAAKGVQSPDEAAHMEIIAGLFITDRKRVLVGIDEGMEE
jgi:hypothetical protein